MDWIEENLGISTGVQGKLLASILVVAVVIIVRALILRAIHSRFEEAWVEYRARKVATYTATIVSLLTIGFIWIDAFSGFPTFLGLVSAGIAIGLADVLKNLAGWIYIIARRPFRVGDRIEIQGTKGDVVDLRLFRFSMLEVGNWVDAEQSTGRLIHVPNGLLFNVQVANYTEAFPFIWHEIPVLVTFESNRATARRMIEDAVHSHAPDVERTAGAVMRDTASSYHLRLGALTPIVYLTVKDSGVLFTARFLVEARTQRGIDERIWTAILDSIDEVSDVELAYPTIRTYLHGPIGVARVTDDEMPPSDAN